MVVRIRANNSVVLRGKNKMEYFVGLKIDSYYCVHIIENGIEDRVMVCEDNIDGFIQCLEHFGFKQM